MSSLTRETTIGIVRAIVSSMPPSLTTRVSVPEPSAIFSGSAKETARPPIPSSATSLLCTSTPSTVATATAVPFGTPPSARDALSVALTVSPGP